MILLVASDISMYAYDKAKETGHFKADELIDGYIDMVGKNGTLLFPTYNWDFCEGKTFDIREVNSQTGRLSNTALSRSDFIRTRHPIYSFAVRGKDAEYLEGLNNIGAFDKESPFGYLHKNKTKMLIIGLEYQNSFTFVHYVEQQERVDYRYEKEFTAEYIDEDGIKSIRTYSMYVRNLKRKVRANINPIGRILEENGIAETWTENKTKFTLIDLAKAYEVICDDIKFNGAKNLYVEG